MSSEETRAGGSQTGSDEGNNVVRIPRDWFGPKDDLVPFGPRAWPEAEDRAGLSAGAAGDAATPLDAETFWGEDADSVHDVVAGRSAVASGGPARENRRTVIAAGVVVLLIAAAGLTVWLAGSPQRRSSPPEIASVRNKPLVPARRLLHTAANRSPATSRTLRFPVPRQRPVRHRSTAPRTTHPTQVVYRPVQTASTGAPRPAAVAPASTVAAPTRGSSASTAAQPTSSSQVSQPAFGASGALGPMSSPAG